MTTAPCNCAARWSNVACSCSWRDHLTKPLRVEIPWLFDDGTSTEDATLSGLVYPDHDVDGMILTIDATGDEVSVPRKLRRAAEGELRQAAHDLWRRTG